MKMSDELDTPAIFTTRNSWGNFQTKLTHNGTRPHSQACDRTPDTVSNAMFTLIFVRKHVSDPECTLEALHYKSTIKMAEIPDVASCFLL